MRRPLSVIVPCKNEEANIAPCIASFYHLADDILVADSGSTDRTLEIARQFDKVRVIQREYITSGDFKNWAIPQAAHEWVLLVDADERVTPELADEIELVLSRGPEFAGYEIYRNNHFMGHPLHWGDARTDRVVRLFRRDVSRYEGPSDHGEIQVSCGRIGQLRGRLMHYTCWSYDQYFRKFHRYTALQAAQWHDERRDTSYFKLLVRPWLRFVREYIVQGGIFDGKAGLQLAWLAAFYSFSKQARLWALHHARTLEQVDPLCAPAEPADSHDRQAHRPAA
jgi:(heptosyl)LPS beta-1,4-glucosyltransferase